MSSDLVGSIGLLLVFLSFSFFFSGAETAITAAGKGKLYSLAQTHPQSKGSLYWLIDNTQRALTVTLIGNNLVNIAASSLAASVAITIFGNRGLFYAVTVMTALIVIFCEILPKNIAIVGTDRILLLSLPLLRLISFIATPIAWFVQKVVLVLGKLVGMDLNAFNPFITREEFNQIVKQGEVSGALEEDERKMIYGIISFEGTRVSEIMIPRTDIVALRDDALVSEAVTMFRETGHSRVPVYSTDLDHVEGILYVKDLLAPLSDGKLGESVSHFQRKCTFIPETMKTDEAFELMKKEKVHLLIVVDEHGGTAGLISLEDLIEEIVGDIQDEYDSETPPICDDGNQTYLVQGYVNVEDLSEALGYDFDCKEVDTVGGMVLLLSGNFPQEGQIIRNGPWVIEVMEVKDHRVLQVRLRFEPEPEVE